MGTRPRPGATTRPPVRPSAHTATSSPTEFDGRTDVDARFSPLQVTGEITPVMYAGRAMQRLQPRRSSDVIADRLDVTVVRS